MSFRALAEKSPAAETKTIVRVTRRDEGVPPYRRLRRESYLLSFRALAEKSPAAEMETIVHDYPEYSPAGAPCFACGGSPPRNPLRQKRKQPYANNSNTCLRGLRALPAWAPRLACGGSPPRNPLRQKRKQSYALRGGTRASRPTDGFAANRTPCHFER